MDHKRKERPAGSGLSARAKKPRNGGVSAVATVFKVLGTLFLIGICTAAIMAGIFLKYVDTTLAPSLYVNADDYTMNLSSFIYYEDQETGTWKEWQTIHGNENRVLATADEIPDALWQAVVAIEDHRFFEHEGVDWRRTVGAAVNIFTNDRDTFGGSTITQQVLKNMTGDDKGTINRKVREIFRALEFEKHYTKEEILVMYLNSIYLGKGCYGVKTAAEFYFGKELHELTVAECASLIAITNNPSLYGPKYDITFTRDDGTTITPRELNKRRQENILLRMAGGNETVGITGLDYLTMEEAEAACEEELQFTGEDSPTAEELVERQTGTPGINSWFVDEVIRDVTKDLSESMGISTEEAEILLYNSGYKIYTTLDPEIQAIAEAVYEDRSNLDVTSRNGQKIQSGITILDPYTGNVAALVGAIGPKEGNLRTNFARLKRQPGSSIKPLTSYAPALDDGAVNPGTAFDDYPVQPLNGNPWPKNSPNKYRGRVQVNTGIQHSINTIAVQTLQAVGVDKAFAFATENLRLDLVAADMDISPLGMGGLTYGLTTEQMAAAYAAFANNGVYNEPRTYLRVENADGEVILENEGETHVAMKETTAYLMTQMLKTAVSSGTGTSARFNGMTIAGKTGTTSDNYDRYFVGYTPYYVAAVWTGYQFNERISYSGNPAITMWKKVMQQIHEELPNKDFAKPAGGLTTIEVCRDSGLRCSDACRADVRGSRAVSVTVAAGTEPTETCTLHAYRSYCTAGKCLATENCPADTVIQAAFLDMERVNYGSAVKAEDDAYLIPNMEKAVGLRPTVAEDGTESYPAVIGCPVHAGGVVTDPDDPNYDPSNPDASLDPSDPNYNPPSSGGNGENHGGTTTPPGQTEDPQPPVTPSEPEVPTEPVTPPSGGGDDWAANLWG